MTHQNGMDIVLLRIEEVHWNSYSDEDCNDESHFVFGNDVEPFPITNDFLKSKFVMISNELWPVFNGPCISMAVF